jgi:hypothetical protein
MGSLITKTHRLGDRMIDVIPIRLISGKVSQRGTTVRIYSFYYLVGGELV